MSQETLSATKRITSGTRASKRLRREGRVPAVVYGTDLDAPHPVHINSRDLYAVLHTDQGLNAIIEVDVEGEKVLTVAREVQRDPVRGDITHLDLIQVNLKVAIEAEVHIEYVGIPVGVVDDGAIVETLEQTITLMALPNAIPSSVEVDISHLELHDTLTVADLPTIDGVEYTLDDEHPLLTVLLPAAEVEPEPVLTDMMEGDEDGEEGEEGEDSESDGDSDSSED
jgi:large subunit ribosomal protein L25